jgi:hypothetical protein
MHNQFKFYCFVAYTPLNMLCPSSGAPSNCLCSHWLPYDCRVERVSTRQLYGNQWLQRQLVGTPDGGHNSARNILSGIRDKAINFKLIVHLVGCFIEYL